MRVVLISALLALLLCACSDGSGGNALVRVSLEVPAAPQARLVADAQEIKSEYTVALHVRVSAEDMTTEVSAEAVVGQDENFDGLVELEMEVPAGSARSFNGLLFSDDLKTYANAAPVTMDLPEGKSVDLELTLKRLETGSLTVNLPQAAEGLYLTLEEESSALRMPAVSCEPESCAYPAAPLGLSLLPVLLNPDGSEERLDVVELNAGKPDVEIDAEN